jgi:Ca2+-binding RTX toxin-like protein
MLVLALAAVALLATPTVASTASVLVIYGAHSGSHLTLSSNGRQIVAEGLMAHKQPQGCHLGRHRMRAVCPLRGAAQVELRMGPAGDFVDVANRLPISVVAYLGGGSDKFIGNGERDTCFSQGARRNRCVGGPGNDTCITGNQNSDCVGGSGNDYCHTGDGSDGCWGGPGRDVCFMGPGEDGCHGEGGNDRLYGGPGADQLYGGAGWNFCDGLPGTGKSHECSAGPRH